VFEARVGPARHPFPQHQELVRSGTAVDGPMEVAHHDGVESLAELTPDEAEVVAT